MKPLLMNSIDYACNDLIKFPIIRTLKFLPSDQSDLYRSALKRLEADGYWVGRGSLKEVSTEVDFLCKLSQMISAPVEIQNWGMFEDCLYDMSWIYGQPRGYYFYMEEAIRFWKHDTLVASILSNVFQPISLRWMKRGVPFILIFEMS